MVIAALTMIFSGCVAEPAQESSATASTTGATTSGDQANATASGTAADMPSMNTAPSAEINASALEGNAPFEVVFSLNGTDADNDNLTWTLDVGDNATAPYNGTGLPTSVNHTFEAAGNYTVLFSVSDEENTTSANITITVRAAAPAATSGLPVPDGSVNGNVFAYQSVAGAGVGVSNVISTGTGAAGDPVPKYPAGSDVQISARSVSSEDVDIETSTPVTFTLYKPDGTIAMGPIEGTGSADGSAIQYTVGTQKFPTARGEYLMCFTLDVEGVLYYVNDDSTDSGGLRMIEIV